MFLYLAAIAPAIAASILASSKTINGASPPSSMETFLTVLAHSLSSIFPVSVDPVNVNLRTKLLSVIALPIVCALPVSTFNSPLGKPACSAK